MMTARHSVSAAILSSLATVAGAQDVATLYTLNEQIIEDQLSADELRVETMQRLLSAVEPELVEELLVEHMTNRTKKVIDYGAGAAFVEYTSADVETFPWRPGEAGAAQGSWSIETDKAGAKSVCFQTETVTDSAAEDVAEPACIPAAYVLAEYCTIGVAEADVFDLNSGDVPFLTESLDVPGLVEQ